MPETKAGPTRSHSQLSSWLDCGRAYELGRILGIPRRPGVWFPAGTAVHASVERYLREAMESKGIER